MDYCSKPTLLEPADIATDIENPCKHGLYCLDGNLCMNSEYVNNSNDSNELDKAYFRTGIEKDSADDVDYQIAKECVENNTLRERGCDPTNIKDIYITLGDHTKNYNMDIVKQQEYNITGESCEGTTDEQKITPYQLCLNKNVTNTDGKYKTTVASCSDTDDNIIKYIADGDPKHSFCTILPGVDDMNNDFSKHVTRWSQIYTNKNFNINTHGIFKQENTCEYTNASFQRNTYKGYFPYDRSSYADYVKTIQADPIQGEFYEIDNNPGMCRAGNMNIIRSGQQGDLGRFIAKLNSPGDQNECLVLNGAFIPYYQIGGVATTNFHIPITLEPHQVGVLTIHKNVNINKDLNYGAANFRLRIDYNSVYSTAAGEIQTIIQDNNNDPVKQQEVTPECFLNRNCTSNNMAQLTSNVQTFLFPIMATPTKDFVSGIRQLGTIGELRGYLINNPTGTIGSDVQTTSSINIMADGNTTAQELSDFNIVMNFQKFHINSLSDNTQDSPNKFTMADKHTIMTTKIIQHYNDAFSSMIDLINKFKKIIKKIQASDRLLLIVPIQDQVTSVIRKIFSDDINSPLGIFNRDHPGATAVENFLDIQISHEYPEGAIEGISSIITNDLIFLNDEVMNRMDTSLASLRFIEDKMMTNYQDAEIIHPHLLEIFMSILINYPSIMTLTQTLRLQIGLYEGTFCDVVDEVIAGGSVPNTLKKCDNESWLQDSITSIRQQAASDTDNGPDTICNLINHLNYNSDGNDCSLDVTNDLILEDKMKKCTYEQLRDNLKTNCLDKLVFGSTESCSSTCLKYNTSNGVTSQPDTGACETCLNNLQNPITGICDINGTKKLWIDSNNQCNTDLTMANYISNKFY